MQYNVENKFDFVIIIITYFFKIDLIKKFVAYLEEICAMQVIYWNK